jgi:predicted PurR-regulated permease PerM
MSISPTNEQKQTLLWIAFGLVVLLLLRLLAPVLMPFIVAAILAYILNPWVDKLAELRFRNWQFPRSVAASVVMVVLIALIILVFLIVVPVFQKELPQLQDQIPRFLDKLNAVLSPFLQKFGIKVSVDSAGIKELLAKQFATSGDVIGKAVISSIRVGGTAVLGMLANVLLIPIVLFYLMMDWHALVSRIETYIPRRWVATVLKNMSEVDELLAQYLRGQILVMISLAAYYCIALSIVGFELALPVGLVTGLLAFIPYLGFGIGLTLALVGAFLQYNDLTGLIAVGAIYGFGQVIESFFLTPRLVGERIGLHPVTVIFALLAFGELFGFVGILVALPVCAILSVAIRQFREFYFRSTFYDKT